MYMIVSVFDSQDFALVAAAEFALKDKKELAGVGNALMLFVHAVGMETVEILGIAPPLGVERECFLELALLVFGKAADDLVQVAEVLNAVGDTLAGAETQRAHGLDTITGRGVLLVVVSKVQLPELLRHPAADLRHNPLIVSVFPANPDTSDLRLLWHDDIVQPQTSADEVRQGTQYLPLLILHQQDIPLLAGADGIHPPRLHGERKECLRLRPSGVLLLI